MLAIVIFAVVALQPASVSSPGAEPVAAAVTPKADSVIAPGPFALSVTYDQPMQYRSFSFVQATRGTYPDCSGAPGMSRDRRTFTLSCTAQPGRDYEVWFNRQPYMNFRSRAGVPARPYRRLFVTRPR